MAIVVKSGTVLSASGKTTIGKDARIAVDAKIGKSVTNLSEGTSSKDDISYIRRTSGGGVQRVSTSSTKPTTTFTDSTGKELSPYEQAVVEKTAAPATNVKTGATDYYTYSIENTNTSSKPDSFKPIPSGSTVQDSLSAASFDNRVARANEREVAPVQTSNKGFLSSNVERVKQRGRDNFEAFRFGLSNPNDAPSIYSDSSRPLTERAGAYTGAFLNIAPATSFTTGVAKSAFTGAKNVVRTLGTPIRVVGEAVVKGAPVGLKTVTGVLYTVEATALAGKLGYEGVKATGSKESRSFISTGDARLAFETANAAALGGKGKVDQYIASNIPGGSKSVGYDMDAFDSSVRDYARSKSFNEESFLKAVNLYGKARKTGTTAAILTGNTASETVGNALFSFSKAFTSGSSIPVKGAFSKLFFQGARVTGSAGIGEGAGIVLGSELASGKNLEQVSFRNVGIGAGAGAVTAATLGGTIYATSILSPRISKVLLGAAYVTEPAEYFGDVAGSVSGAGVIKTKGAITFTNSLTDTKSSSRTPVNTPSSTPVNSISGVKVLTSGVFTPTSTPTSTPVSPYSPVNIRSSFFSATSTPSNVFTPTNVNTPVNTPTNVNTPVNTPTNVNTNVFITTPTPRIPFLPLFGGSNKGNKQGLGDFFKQNRAYNPSLTASILGIRGGKPSDFGIKTGLAIRPIL